MSNNCRAQIQACATRVSRLYLSGVPAQGANNLYVSDALVSLGFTAELATGEETEVKNACGASIVNFKDCDRLKRLNIELSLATPDPELTELLVGGAVLTSGADVGYGFPALNEAQCKIGVSVELWAKRITGGGTIDPDAPYAWWVFPWVELQINSATFENGPYQPTFQGIALENENWHDGPENDWLVESDRVAQWMPTDVLPEVDCGYQTLIAS